MGMFAKGAKAEQSEEGQQPSTDLETTERIMEPAPKKLKPATSKGPALKCPGGKATNATSKAKAKARSRGRAPTPPPPEPVVVGHKSGDDTQRTSDNEDQGADFNTPVRGGEAIRASRIP